MLGHGIGAAWQGELWLSSGVANEDDKWGTEVDNNQLSMNPKICHCNESLAIVAILVDQAGHSVVTDAQLVFVSWFAPNWMLGWHEKFWNFTSQICCLKHSFTDGMVVACLWAVHAKTGLHIHSTAHCVQQSVPLWIRNSNNSMQPNHLWAPFGTKTFLCMLWHLILANAFVDKNSRWKLQKLADKIHVWVNVPPKCTTTCTAVHGALFIWHSNFCSFIFIQLEVAIGVEHLCVPMGLSWFKVFLIFHISKKEQVCGKLLTPKSEFFTCHIEMRKHNEFSEFNVSSLIADSFHCHLMWCQIVNARCSLILCVSVWMHDFVSTEHWISLFQSAWWLHLSSHFISSNWKLWPLPNFFLLSQGMCLWWPS